MATSTVSTRPSSSRLPKSAAPPKSQMSLPSRSLRSRTKPAMSSATRVASGTSSCARVREAT